MSLDFLDDVFLLNFSLEAAESVLDRLALLNSDFGHCLNTPNLLLHADKHYPAMTGMESNRTAHSATASSPMLYCATVMAKCPLCSQRSGKRFCPAKGVKICPTCCGTKREIEIECPSDCAYLKQGRRYESNQNPIAPATPHREFSQQFRHRYASVITTLAQVILEERVGNSSLLDSDVREALEALKATTRTLSAGIYYETLPESGAAPMSVYRGLKSMIDEMMKPQGPTHDALRASEAPDVVDFIAVSLDLHSGGRPKSRRYLDWLSSVAPAPVKHESGHLIVP